MTRDLVPEYLTLKIPLRLSSQRKISFPLTKEVLPSS